MADLLAEVVRAVQFVAAFLLTRELGLATQLLHLLLATEALKLLGHAAGTAGTGVARLITPVEAAVESLVADIFAAVGAAQGNLAGDILG